MWSIRFGFPFLSNLARDQERALVGLNFFVWHMQLCRGLGTRTTTELFGLFGKFSISTSCGLQGFVYVGWTERDERERGGDRERKREGGRERGTCYYLFASSPLSLLRLLLPG